MPKKITKRAKPKTRAKKGKKMTFAKRVKAVVSSIAEHKSYAIYGANQQIGTASASVPGSIYLLPVIAQGVTESTRIGNEIKVASGRVNGYVNILPYNASTNTLSTAVMVKIWLVSYKTLNSSTFSATNVASDWFETNSSTVGMQGNMLDMVFPVNPDSWTVHSSKTFKIGASSATATGQVGTGGYYDNSPMNVPFHFNWGKYVKSKLIYNDNTTVCTNKNMWLVFQTVYADGSSSSVYPCEMHFHSHCTFTDL